MSLGENVGSGAVRNESGSGGSFVCDGNALIDCRATESGFLYVMHKHRVPRYLRLARSDRASLTRATQRFADESGHPCAVILSRSGIALFRRGLGPIRLLPPTRSQTKFGGDENDDFYCKLLASEDNHTRGASIERRATGYASPNVRKQCR
jgi:hypothetical protein